MRFAGPRPISLRSRLAILFAAGSAMTLLLTALLLWHNLNAELNSAIDTGLETVRRAQDRLALILVVVGPTLITVLAVGGWLLAHEALRPVGRMTAEADTISLAEPGRRLRQPPGDDEIARLGRTLNTMLGRMEASFAREKAFVDDASHELRTPISILRGELELALAQPGSREDTERTLRSALEEAERLGRLAEDLLVLARSTSGDL